MAEFIPCFHLISVAVACRLAGPVLIPLYPCVLTYFWLRGFVPTQWLRIGGSWSDYAAWSSVATGCWPWFCHSG